MIYWKRKDYEAYQATFIDPRYVQECRDEYPKRTATAVSELRERGIDIRYVQLRYMAQKGLFTPEGGGQMGSDHKWSAELIDQVAEHCVDVEPAKGPGPGYLPGMLTPTSRMCFILNIDYHQYQMALLKAGKEISDMSGPGDPTWYKIIIHPGKPGRGKCGRVEFLPPDKK